MREIEPAPLSDRLGRRYRLLGTFYIAVSLVALILVAGGPVPNTNAAIPASTPATWQKSITLQSRGSDDFGSAGSDASITQAQQANANFLTLIIPYQQANVNSSYIFKAPYAPTDSALIHAINKAHSLGMKVAFKFHVDPNDYQWRAYINPTDRNSWFSNYGSILNYYATLGQQNGVEQMVIGAELISLSTSTSNSDNTQRWRTMISQVRQRFSGKLTYSANWGGCYFCEEFPHISFWDALDYIGISAYFELANYNNPSVSQLMDSWNYWNTNKIQPVQQSVGKPVIFTEVGYRSVDGATQHPWDWSMSGNYNPQEQVNGLDALTQYWSKYSWFNGLQYWDWKTDSNCCGTGDTGYEVQNKPGYTAMQTDFSNGGGPTPLSFSLTGGSVTPASASPGSAFTLNAGITASAASTALIDMEVYNSAGTKVYQQFASNQAFTAGQTRNFTFNWASPVNQPAGEYTLSVGVFSNDWKTSYLWSSTVTTFKLNSASPTPTPTPGNPTPTPAGPTPTPKPTSTPGPGQYTLEIWWPANGITLSGIQPFKAKLSNLDLSQYNLYWQVDGGQLNLMSNSSTDAPHKESAVNTSSWNWRGSGPYTINFVAKDLSGNQLSQQSIQIYVQN